MMNNMKKKYLFLALAALIPAVLFSVVISFPSIRQTVVLFLCGAPTRFLESMIGRSFNPLTLATKWDRILELIMNIVLGIIFLLALSVILYIELFVIKFKQNGDRTTAVCITVLLFFSSMGIGMMGHDIVFHLQRIEDLACAIHAGEIPTHFNYTMALAGNGTSIIYPELFLYIPAVLRALGLPLNLVYKLFCVLINAATLLIAYYSMKRVTRSRYIALIFCALYSLCLYRLININLRAAIGEALGMIFVPLAIAGIYQIFYEKTTGEKKWLTLAIAMSCILQSHIITLFLTSFFIGLFLIIVNPRKKSYFQ